MAMRRRVGYMWSPDVGNYHYGPDHPMKPHRVAVTHSLVFDYKLSSRMQIYRHRRATVQEMYRYHAREYIDFLNYITPPEASRFPALLEKFNLGGHNDCPVFEGMFDFCSLYTGASLTAAELLCQNQCDVAVNWSGGLHHAHRSRAAGFCYVNDIVLAIQELLKYHARVLYLDIDVHHGDGVENAFYAEKRVMTLSFHRYGNDFFPGSGSMYDVGEDDGRFYAVNVPLREGIDDHGFLSVFRPVFSHVMDRYRPSAIVMQCGADSLNGDRLGEFELSTHGHGACVDIVRRENVPLLVLGGGGYRLKNVARCWAYETSVLVGETLSNELPDNDYLLYFGPDYTLHPELEIKRTNRNSTKYLNAIVQHVQENLRLIEPVPSVQMHDVPRDHATTDAWEDRQNIAGSRIEPANEFYSGEKDQDSRPTPMEWDRPSTSFGSAGRASTGVDEQHSGLEQSVEGPSPSCSSTKTGPEGVFHFEAGTFETGGPDQPQIPLQKQSSPGVPVSRELHDFIQLEHSYPIEKKHCYGLRSRKRHLHDHHNPNAPCRFCT